MKCQDSDSIKICNRHFFLRAERRRREVRRVYPSQLYPLETLDDPPRPSQPKAGLGLLMIMVMTLMLMMGHSCNIDNTPNLGGKKLKTSFYVFLVYIWYGFIFTKMGKALGELKQISNTFIWQNLRFFCPRDRLAISDKIICQSLNFICQTLEKLLQFADQTYKLKKCIWLQVFHKIWFFWPKSELVIFSWVL